jgi:serine/threonine protein kinase
VLVLLHLTASLGPYVIEARLSAGGMGEVYRARDTRLGRTVAIKVVAADLAGAYAIDCWQLDRNSRT